MNTLRLSVGTVALLLLSAAASADNCEYTRSKVQPYEAMCRSTGDCQAYNLMKQIVIDECGLDEAANEPPPQRQVQQVRPSGNRGSGAGSSAQVKAPTLQGGSAYDKALQQQQARENDPYNGEACAYFTRDSVESEDGVTRMLYHGENHRVCYGGRMYQCINSRWKALNECTEYPGWKERQAEKLEKKNF